jgi:hypothetical protein
MKSKSLEIYAVLSTKVNALPALHLSRRSLSGCSSGRLQSASVEELSPSLLYRDATQYVRRPSILDWAFKGELCPLPVLPKIQPHKERGAGVRILGEGEMESSYHE